MSRRAPSKNNKKPRKKLSDNSNFVFEVETVHSLTPDSRSVEPSPAKQAFDLATTSQMKIRTEPLNADSVEFKALRKTKSSSKVKKTKPKKPSKQLSFLSASVDVGLSVNTSEGKENNFSASGLATRSTRSRRLLEKQKAVQDSTISTFSETGELNDSSFVTLRKKNTPKKKSDQNSPLKNTPVQSEVESASKPSNKSTGGANNLTYTPSPQVQNNDTHSNCFNVQNKDVFDLVSNTPTQELGNFMLDDGESVLLSDTLYKKMSVVPRLTRTGTFTVTEPVHTPKPQPGRKSIRKRWSLKERTPIFERNPPNKDLKETRPYMDSPRPSALLKVPQVAVEGNHGHPSIFNNTQKADKSVSFFIRSPGVSVARNESAEQQARPSSSNSQKISECSVIDLDSTNLEKSMVRKAPSSKRSNIMKTAMMNEEARPSCSSTQRSSEYSGMVLDSTNSEKSMTQRAPSSKRSTVTKLPAMAKKSNKSSTNLEQEAPPYSSNTGRSSECSVITLNSTNSEISMVQRAPSSKRSTVTKTPAMVEKTVEDSVIILDSTKSERSMFDGDGARLTHKSAMKSTKENKQTKQKKSVKLTSPEFTPRNKKLPPLAVRKTPLLKTVFNGDNSILASNRAEPKGFIGPTASSTPFPPETKDKTNLKAKPSSRVKLPDFKKIHERQFEKMEDLKEYQERKTARAQLLISGSKSNLSKVQDLFEKESKRKLIFSPAIQKILSKPEQERAIKRASLEKQIIQKKQKHLGSKGPKLVLSKPQQLLINKRKSLEKKNSTVNKPEISKGPKLVLSKPQQLLINKRNSLEKKNSTVNKPEIRSAAGKSKLLRKKEEIKSIATKSKAGSSLSQRNKTQVVNVRTNRRFELLMKMREKEGKKS